MEYGRARRVLAFRSMAAAQQRLAAAECGRAPAGPEFDLCSLSPADRDQAPVAGAAARDVPSDRGERRPASLCQRIPFGTDSDSAESRHHAGERRVSRQPLRGQRSRLDLRGARGDLVDTALRLDANEGLVIAVAPDAALPSVADEPGIN